MTTKTDAALAMVDAGATPYAAAKEAGISTSAVYRALKRRAEVPLCPCCGRALKAGQSAPAELDTNAAIRTIEADIKDTKRTGPTRKQNIAKSLRVLLALAEAR